MAAMASTVSGMRVITYLVYKEGIDPGQCPSDHYSSVTSSVRVSISDIADLVVRMNPSVLPNPEEGGRLPCNQISSFPVTHIPLEHHLHQIVAILRSD
jgi:hypothetical protein